MEPEPSLQCAGMNVGKLLCTGLLLTASGCVTQPGDLGAVGESSGSSGAVGSSSEGGTTAQPGTSGVSESTSGGSSSESGDAESDGEESSSTGEPIEPGCTVDLPQVPSRRMTEMQFEHAVEDLFGVEVDVEFADAFLPFDSGESVSIEESVEIQTAADLVADQFEAPACGGDMMTCGQSFIDAWAPLALRGQADAEALMGVYEAEATYADGVAAVVEAMITNPAFAMLTPTGTPEGAFLRLDGPSIATRLSLLMWNSVPDAELMAAADTLAEPGGIEAQLDRMFADPRYARAQGDLYMMLTGIQTLPTMERGLVDASWSSALGESMLEEQRRFVSDLAEDPDATLDALLSSTSTYVNGELATLYGDDLVTPPPGGGAWGPGELDPGRRGGILTQLAFITRHSPNVPPQDYEAPTRRGLAVIQSLACVAIPPPPPGSSGPLDEVDNREDWEAVVLGDAACAGCHVVVDTLGFPFGNYDGLGRWHDSGDSTAASIPTPELDVDDAVDMSQALAEDATVERCIAGRYFEFAMRRRVVEEDTCTVDTLQQAFNESGGNLRALVEATATAEAFVLVRP